MNKKNFKNTTFLTIIACLLWSTAFIGIKVGLKYSAPLHFASIRFIISGLLILPFITKIKEKFKIAFHHKKILLIVSLLQTTFLYAFFYMGLNLVPASIGAILVGSSPLFVALIANFMIKNDKLNPRKIICIILGLIGVSIISITKGGTSIEEYPHITQGLMILIFYNITAGLGNVTVSKYAKDIPPLVLSSIALSMGGIFLWIISYFKEGLTFSLSYPTPYYISLTWLSILSAAAISIWYTLLKRPGVKVSDLNMWKFLVPVIGASLSWIIFSDETPNLLAISGMILIASSLILLNYRKK